VDPADLVREGYEEAAGRYDAWSARRPDLRARFVPLLLDGLPEDGWVVDLGCGGGLGLRHLARHRRAVGVDVARAQLALASARHPDAALVQGDLRSVAFRQGSLAAVLCTFALFHVPREAHPGVLGRIASWLRPGAGRLLVTAGARDNPGGVDPSWLGVPMFWSSYDPDRFVELVRAAGLEPEVAELVDEGDERHLWVLARRR
jgi:SAM-dependent methyltransferase